MITYICERIRIPRSSENVRWCGSQFFRRSSVSKLAFLNNMVESLKLTLMLMGNFPRKYWNGNKREKYDHQ